MEKKEHQFRRLDTQLDYLFAALLWESHCLMLFPFSHLYNEMIGLDQGFLIIAS